MTSAEEEWRATTEAHLFLRDGRFLASGRKLGQAAAWVEFRGPDNASLLLLEALQPRVRGDATRLLEHLLDICDRLRVTISLNPVPYATDLFAEQELVRDRLIAWYEEYGFVRQGEHEWRRAPLAKAGS